MFSVGDRIKYFKSDTPEYSRKYNRIYRRKHNIKSRYSNGLGYTENRQLVKCFICKKDIFFTQHRKHRNKNNFCSRKCFSEYRKNLPPEFQNAWKGGLTTNKKYQTEQRLKRRHLLGISKKYRYEIKKYSPKYYRQKRKALMKKGGELTLETIQQVYENNIKEFGTLTCIYCLNPIQFGKDSLEHIIPLIRGGTNKKENLAIACLSCNSSKKFKLLEEWICA